MAIAAMQRMQIWKTSWLSYVRYVDVRAHYVALRCNYVSMCHCCCWCCWVLKQSNQKHIRVHAKRKMHTNKQNCIFVSTLNSFHSSCQPLNVCKLMLLYVIVLVLALFVVSSLLRVLLLLAAATVAINTCANSSIFIKFTVIILLKTLKYFLCAHLLYLCMNVCF